MNRRSNRCGVAVACLGLAVLLGCAVQDKPEAVPPEEGGKVLGSVAAGSAVASSGAAAAPKPARIGEEEFVPVVSDDRAVFFTLGSAFLTRKEKHKLSVVAQSLAADRSLQILLVGHANDNGSHAYHQTLSQNRVAAVAAFLRRQGISKERIQTRALGGDEVPLPCRSSLCRQKSRRVDLVMSVAE